MICVVVLCRVPRRSPPPRQVKNVAAQALEEVGDRLEQPRLCWARLHCAQVTRPWQLRRRLQQMEWSAERATPHPGQWHSACCVAAEPAQPLQRWVSHRHCHCHRWRLRRASHL